MRSYLVYAQAYVGSQQIKRVVAAKDEASVIPMVYAELDNAGFYVISIAQQ